MKISRLITSFVVLSVQALGSLAFECSNNTQLTETSNPVFSAFGALTCSWIITVSDIYVIQLTLKTHDIDSVGNVNCASDYLQLRDGGNSSSRLLGTVCNTNSSSSEFRSSGNQLWVEYRSTRNQNEFEASFKRVLHRRFCPGDVICNETSGMVYSPFYPADFPNDMDCTWNLIGPPDSRVILTFQWICLGICTTPSSSCDTLEVNNVYSPDILSLGSDLGPSISLQNTVTLSFHTDGQYTSKGFMAKCQAVFRETACSSMVHLRNSSGWFASPNFPLDYPARMECSWNISVPSGYKLLLTFLAFDIEECTTSCACDYVEVRYKPYTQAYAIKKCGTQGAREWNVKSLSNLLVTFKSDGRGNKKGFEAVYVLRPLDAYDTVPSVYCPLTHSTTAESPVTEESHSDIDKPITVIAQTAAASPSDNQPTDLSTSPDSPTTRGNSADMISVSSIVTLPTTWVLLLLFY